MCVNDCDMESKNLREEVGNELFKGTRKRYVSRFMHSYIHSGGVTRMFGIRGKPYYDVMCFVLNKESAFSQQIQSSQ